MRGFVFTQDDQRLRMLENGMAMLDYGEPDSMERQHMSYKCSVSYGLCRTVEGRAAGQMMFMQPMPVPHPEIEQFYMENCNV